MSDHGTGYADKAQERIERRLRKLYALTARTALKELDERLADVYAQDRQRRRTMEPNVYKRWLSDRMNLDTVTKDRLTYLVYAANRQALAVINAERRDVFLENMNYQLYELEKATGEEIKPVLYNQLDVDRVRREEPGVLPTKTVSEPVDRAWNTRRLNALIRRGVISGAPAREIAKNAVSGMCTGSESAMRRYARTAMTGAQNGGRYVVLEEADEDEEFRVTKVWCTVGDDRVREAHEDLDGQEVDIDEPFDSELGPIRYPGDPEAALENIMNCRCWLDYNYYEEDDDDEELPYRRRKKRNPTVPYETWKRIKRRNRHGK